MKRLLAGVVLLGVAMSTNAAPLENYFECSLNDGKTMQDAVQFLRSYQAAVKEKWDDYPVKILMPVYSDYRGPGKFVWFGGFDSSDMHDITTWFQGSEWPERFEQVMTCGSSSLWRRLE